MWLPILTRALCFMFDCYVSDSRTVLYLILPLTRALCFVFDCYVINNIHTKITWFWLAKNECFWMHVRAFDKINRNKMAAAVGKVWREQKHILIQAKFSWIKGNNKYISQSKWNWKFGQYKSGLMKPLKATNRGFSYATVRNEGWLQAWIEGVYFSPYLYNRKKIKAPDNTWQRALKFKSIILIHKPRKLRNVSTRNGREASENVCKFDIYSQRKICMCIINK